MPAHAQDAPQASTVIWSDERVAQLRRLWTDEGLSTAKIATALSATADVPISRSAVLGKLHRLGLTEADKPGRAMPEPVPARATRSTRGSEAARDGAPAIPAAPTPPAEAPPPATAPAPVPAAAPHPALTLPFRPARAVPKPNTPPSVSLIDARPHHCRWPLDTPASVGFRFCGAPVADLRWSWCEAHRAVGFYRRGEGERRGNRPAVPVRRIGGRAA